MSYVYSGDKVRLPAEVVLGAVAKATTFFKNSGPWLKAGFFFVFPGEDGIVKFSELFMEPKTVYPGTICVPVRTLLAKEDATLRPLPLGVAMGERADLMAEVWEELWNSDVDYPEPEIQGGDPAAMELDPDAPEIDPASACVVAPCEGLLEVSGEFGPRKMAEAEGRACAQELLRVGSPEDVRKRAIAPCPYPLGSAARVWWCWGLNQVVKAAEEAALGEALVERYKNS